MEDWWVKDARKAVCRLYCTSQEEREMGRWPRDILGSAKHHWGESIIVLAYMKREGSGSEEGKSGGVHVLCGQKK